MNIIPNKFQTSSFSQSLCTAALRWVAASACLAAIAMFELSVLAQAVCLPAPRLLTTTPMGGQVGSTVEVSITSANAEDADELTFSHPGITATNKLDKEGRPVPNKFVVTISKDCPTGLHEARIMTRLGVSSSRVFNIGTLPETSRTSPNTSSDKAMAVDVNSICNAAMTNRAIDYYSFQAQKDQRIVVDCAAKGIDSKLKAVLIIADAEGNDLVVERRGGALDFTAPAAGNYFIKVHDLTFNGGPAYFYRLVIQEVPAGESISRPPSTKTVSSFSWPPHGLSDKNLVAEKEPNNKKPQKITLPCDLSGSFFPAADVDTFEFTAKKGEVWWVEVASERLGLATDPSIVVQQVTSENGQEKLTDVVELADIPSPVKVSSNGYSYDGPPYNAGSTDILGKLEIKQDGLYRLQLLDLFGGTRNEPQNIYRLIVRKAAPDFALVGWALHMNLRNGDRNALSKPIALRGGATMPIEVVVVRRDGFNGEIDLMMEGLPNGVSATGLKIASGKSRGIMLLTANQDAPRGLTSASFLGRAMIDGQPVTRHCHLASMSWPVPNAWSEVPSPRLLADVPVSVCGSELAPITIAPAEDKVWELTAGQSHKIPLVHQRRCEFSGASIQMKTFGAGFEATPAFDAPLAATTSQVTLNLAALKTPPGEYVIAFYGSAVAKYRYNQDGIAFAEAALKRAQKEVIESTKDLASSTEAVKVATKESKGTAELAAKQAAARKKSADAAVAAATKRVKDATARAAPKDIVDIVVSKPIRIRVKPAEKK